MLLRTHGSFHIALLSVCRAMHNLKILLWRDMDVEVMAGMLMLACASPCGKKRKEKKKKKKTMPFGVNFNEKPCIIPGCPEMCITMCMNRQAVAHLCMPS